MFREFDYQPSRTLRGGTVILSFPKERVVTELEKFPKEVNPNTKVWDTALGWRTAAGVKAAAEVGVKPNMCRGGSSFIINGSSSPTAWVREDLELLLAAEKTNPNQGAVIAVALGNNPLMMIFQMMADSYSLLGREREETEKIFRELVAQEPDRYKIYPNLAAATNDPKLLETIQLAKRNPERLGEILPANCIFLPRKSDLLTAFQNLGLHKALPVVEAVGRELPEEATWADFIATYRYAVAMIINYRFFSSKPLTLITWEELARISGYAEQPVEALAKDLRIRYGEARVVNFHCPFCARMREGEGIHSLKTDGQIYGPSGKIKKCRSLGQALFQAPLGTLLEDGVGLSGASIYLLIGKLGELGGYASIVRDYSKGRVLYTLRKPLSDPENGLLVIPTGALYMFARGGNHKISVDSLVFFELLERWGADKAGAVMGKIKSSLPIPMRRVGEETLIEVSLEGIKISTRMSS